MFIGDQVRAAASQETATARLAALARGSALAQASQAAWETGTAKPGYLGQEPASLTRALWRGPQQRGLSAVLILRWETADAAGRLFPALDADLVLTPEAEQATLVGLTGVLRAPPGTPPLGYSAAATIIRTFLARVAGAINDAPAPLATTGSPAYTVVHPQASTRTARPAAPGPGTPADG